MARRSPTGRFPALRQGRRREMQWVSFAPQRTAFTSNQVTVLGVLNAAALAARPFTLIRTRGWLRIGTDQSANTEAQFCTYGHIVVKETATTAGVASIPTPITEATADWHVFEMITAGVLVSSATSVLEFGFQRGFDSKSMRKVGDDDDIAIVAEAPATGISEGFQLVDAGRVLIKLH